MKLSLQERIERFKTMYLEGRLIHGVWHGTDNIGRETACWAGAFGKDIDGPAKCPAELMPKWLVNCLVVFDDGVDAVDRARLSAMLFDIAPKFLTMTSSNWRRAELKTHKAILEVVLPLDGFEIVAPIINLIDRELDNEVVEDHEWSRSVWTARDALEKITAAAMNTAFGYSAAADVAKTARYVALANSKFSHSYQIAYYAILAAARQAGIDGNKIIAKICEACFTAINDEAGINP